MRIAGEPAFVLHARPWRETSLLVEVLTANHGRVGLVARGVRSARRQPLRAALQPLQCVRLDAVQQGELAQLRSAEALDAAPLLAGEAALAAFYVNELVLRLAPRNDPQHELFDAYATMRARLGDPAQPLAWTLRRFEAALLEALGFGLDYANDVDGQAIDPAARYRLDPEQGPRRLLSDRGRADRSDAATGSALLALAGTGDGTLGDDTPGSDTPGSGAPPADDLAGLRRALRPVLLHHLGGRPLRSWDLIGALGRIGPDEPGIPPASPASVPEPAPR
jgi:DNA repair protein RecO (recombination protein O)